MWAAQQPSWLGERRAQLADSEQWQYSSTACMHATQPTDTRWFGSMHFMKETISATHPNSASWSLLLKQPGHLRRGPAGVQQQTSVCQYWGEGRVRRLQLRTPPFCPAPYLPSRCGNGGRSGCFHELASCKPVSFLSTSPTWVRS